VKCPFKRSLQFITIKQLRNIHSFHVRTNVVMIALYWNIINQYSLKNGCNGKMINNVILIIKALHQEYITKRLMNRHLRFFIAILSLEFSFIFNIARTMKRWSLSRDYNKTIDLLQSCVPWHNKTKDYSMYLSGFIIVIYHLRP
jgi:hypothetical protein